MAFFWVFLASAGQIAKDILSKRMSLSISGGLSAFCSFLFPLPLYLLLLLFLRAIGVEDFHIGEGFLLAVFLRASTDTVAESSKMYALQTTEFSTFATISSLHSVVVLLLSPMITGDPLTMPIVLGASVSVVGAILTTFGGGTLPSRKGLFYSLASLFSFALMSCFDRISVRTASGPVAAFSMTLLSTLFLLPFAFRGGESIRQIRSCVRPLTARSVLEVMNMTSKLIAMQYLTAPEVTTLMRLNLVAAVIAGQKLFDERGFARRLIGVVLVLVGALLILREHLP